MHKKFTSDQSHFSKKKRSLHILRCLETSWDVLRQGWDVSWDMRRVSEILWITSCDNCKYLHWVVFVSKELVRQGEKLQNIDQRLDEVDQTLTATQKNINQIKSIFGGLKNRFMRTSKEKNPLPSSSSSSSLNSQRQSFQPQSTTSKADFVPITGSDREKDMFKNLEEMSVGLSHITSLARDMSAELDRQNSTIDRITVKTDRTNAKINAQNTQMKKIRWESGYYCHVKNIKLKIGKKINFKN